MAREFTGLIKATRNLFKEGVEAYFSREVTLYGNGAKVSCPKEYHKNPALVIILKNGKQPKNKKLGKKE